MKQFLLFGLIALMTFISIDAMAAPTHHVRSTTRFYTKNGCNYKEIMTTEWYSEQIPGATITWGHKQTLHTFIDCGSGEVYLGSIDMDIVNDSSNNAIGFSNIQVTPPSFETEGTDIATNQNNIDYWLEHINIFYDTE